MIDNTFVLPDERLDRVNENIILIQKKNGLTFGTDALLLAAFIRNNPKKTALDFGAGSGIVSFLCMARRKFRHVGAVELQPEFCSLIERNIRLNHFEQKVSCINEDVRLLRPDALGMESDVIFTNPPYMRAGSGKTNFHTIKTMARHEICGNIEDFCAAAERNLKFGGLFYAIYRPDRMAELFSAMRSVCLEPKRLLMVYPDIASPPSLLLTEGKKGANPGLKNMKPLILYENIAHTSYTKDFQYIYDHGDIKE